MAKAKREQPEIWDRACIPITLDQLQLANKIGHAAATGAMPRQSFKSKFEEDKAAGKVGPGEYLIPGDLRVNHAAFAIMELFPGKTDADSKLRKSVLWRAIFIADKVYGDPRAQLYFSEAKGGKWIGWPLLEAMAITPMNIGEEVPLNDIFAKAAELATEHEWNRDAEPFESQS